MHLYPCDIANHLETFTKDPGEQERPGAVIDAEYDLAQEASRKEGEEEGVTAQRGNIVHAGPIHGTCSHGTEIVVVVEGLIEDAIV